VIRDLRAQEVTPGVDEVYNVVEEMPVFAGGSNSLFSFIRATTVYPKELWKKGIHGTVFISFVVAPDGNTTKVKLEKGIPGGEELNKEAYA
jgi:periplasmic protein TonB